MLTRLLLTAVLCLGLDQAGAAQAQSAPPQSVKIDAFIAARWKENGIVKPSRRAADLEWARRVSLDLRGRIMTSGELAAYLSDPGQSRRGVLIERLLKDEEFSENWASIWTALLVGRSGNSHYREQLRSWLEKQCSTNRAWDKIVADLLTVEDDNATRGSVNFILSHLGEPTPKARIAEEGTFNFLPITGRTTRLFLGLQTQCTQCHDHPFNPQWKQKHFWGVNTFFRQVIVTRLAEKEAPPRIDLRDDTLLNPSQMIALVFDPRLRILATRASFLDGKKYNPAAGTTRRQQLARYVVDHEMFAKAAVNRTWAHFFGRGLTVNGKDVDDFGEHNAETHPELLDYLAREFIASGYDSRALMKWICHSQAYNLSSVADGQVQVEDASRNKITIANDQPEHEPWFSRTLLRPLSPEQLLASLWVATRPAADSWGRLPTCLPGSSASSTGPRWPGRLATCPTRAEMARLRDEWISRFVANLGDDEGNEATLTGTITEALALMNGKEVNDALIVTNGPVETAIRRRGTASSSVMDKPIMDELFLATLNRLPTREEIRKIRESVRVAMPEEKSASGPWQDLTWALLNSSEFSLNH